MHDCIECDCEDCECRCHRAERAEIERLRRLLKESGDVVSAQIKRAEQAELDARLWRREACRGPM